MGYSLAFVEPATTVASTRMLIGETTASMMSANASMMPKLKGRVIKPRDIITMA